MLTTLANFSISKHPHGELTERLVEATNKLSPLAQAFKHRLLG